MNQDKSPTNTEKPDVFGEKMIPEYSTKIIFFSVSIRKFIIMLFFTHGIYTIYWFYKNWKLIKERENIQIKPFLRSIFSYVFCYSLFRTVELQGESLGLRRSIASAPLALCWIAVSLLAHLVPNPYWLLSYFGMLLLVPVQILANDINGELSPGHDENGRITDANVVAIVIGSMFFLLMLVGTFFPPEETNF